MPKRNPKATVYRAFGERTFIEQNQSVGYGLSPDMFREWWLEWFWNSDKHLSEVNYKVAGLSLHFMAAMVDAGDA